MAEAIEEGFESSNVMSTKPFKPLTIKKADIVSPSVHVQCFEAPPSKRRKLSSDEEDDSDISPSSSKRPSRVQKASVPHIPAGTPLKEIHNSSSPTENKSTGLESYFSVLWRIPTQKKNKTWTNDGVLAVKSGHATLYDSTGKELGQSTCMNPLLPGSALKVAGKEVEIDDSISRRDYLNVANLKTATATTVTVKESKPLPSANERFQSQAKQPMSLQAQMKAQIMIKKEAGSGNSNRPNVNGHQNRNDFKQPLKECTVLKQGPSEKPIPRHDPNLPGAVVFKRPKKAPPGQQMVDVVLDPILGKHLREHQKQGVRFLYECVMGLRDGNTGCILADEMGLGKTLQTIALLWTLTKQNPVYKASPVVKKALVVCPAGLVKNWKKEFNKWLGSHTLGVLVFDEKDQRLRDFDGKVYQVMIVGYERLRSVADELADGGVDIVICDEGHRLKTVKNKSAQAIDSLNASKRIILSGTPIQNDLSEFFAMVNFVNDGCLGTYKAFQKDFETPIIKSRQPNATEKDIERGVAAGEDLAKTTSPFILRRTADVLANCLPPKTEYVLFCKPTSEQAHVYRQVLKSPMFQNALGSNEGALQLITILKKLCNSPLLLKPKIADQNSKADSMSLLHESLPAGLARMYHNAASTKLRVLDELLQQIKAQSDDKVVLVSNYTSTLNLMENLLSSTGLPYLRVDGTIPAAKRQALVDQFNRAKSTQFFAFLLSAKAGGVGINLIGANRLVLFDVDWNPAIDDQAMARIHRQGQKKACSIYRFLMKGGLEERIWQRQVVKRGLADSIIDGSAGAGNATTKKGKSDTAAFSREELKDLFRLDESEDLRTHNLIGCDCGGRGVVASVPQSPNSDLGSTEGGNNNNPEDAQDEELLDFSDLVKASSLKDGVFEKQEERIAAGTHPKQARARKSDKGEELHELMRYLHLATAQIPALDEASERLTEMEDLVNDSCLMNVLKKDKNDLAGGVDYVFLKTNTPTAASVEVQQAKLDSSFFR